MPVTYKIFHTPTLVYIQYSGHVVTQDIVDALSQFAAKDAAYAGQPHFFDMSHVTSHKIDYTEFFKFFGDLAEVYPRDTGEHLFVFYAPEGPPADLADILATPFSQSPTLLVRQARTREQAFDILGATREDVLSELKPAG